MDLNGYISPLLASFKIKKFPFFVRSKVALRRRDILYDNISISCDTNLAVVRSLKRWPMLSQKVPFIPAPLHILCIPCSGWKRAFRDMRSHNGLRLAFLFGLRWGVKLPPPLSAKMAGKWRDECRTVRAGFKPHTSCRLLFACIAILPLVSPDGVLFPLEAPHYNI
jgi:hypothetical protein